MTINNEPSTNGKAAPIDIAYWHRNLAPILTSLMISAGSYSPAEQEKQLAILSEHVLPRLGPRLQDAHTTSFLTQSDSPLQAQMNFRDGEPIVRYCWEPLGPLGGSQSDPYAIDAAREAMQHLSTTFGLCTAWSDPLLEAFVPSPDEIRAVQAILPGWLASLGPASTVPSINRLPFSHIGMDMKGSEVGIKCYFNLKIKEIATGLPVTDMAFDALRKLKPALEPAAIDAVQHFLSERPVPYAIELVGLDWVDEREMSDARIKIYVHSRNNSLNTVRDYVTLGGLIQDETKLSGLQQLSKIWHLLLQEPEGIPDDDYDKPFSGDSALYQKLYFSFELRPGKKLPEVKTYLPTWHYVRTDEETVGNYEEIFRLCGQPWGKEGAYRKLFESAFGPVKHDRPKPVHCDASFLFSSETGIYQTLYWSPPLER
ncbi:Aromatic prenyl transferase [Ophiocordyceps camponoti-floridani]|uniref:Aromatic prenyl transferase n=1 Tax=Ophiocordyceps camponoti-floridani TaxID=2030778 RepID=A0A8H4VCP2_9HYPO|nr:Aromatic prenyl transferase [Ophiocordyceps camponoti-floridani]